MYTRKVVRHLVWGAVVLGASQAHGQASVIGHAGVPGDHIGWNAGTFQPLEIRHDGNQPIEWYTDAIRRMRLNPTTSAYTINSFTGTNVSGYLGLTPDASLWGGAATPFTMLHLHHGTASAQQAGFRPWMQNGVTLTGFGDHMYLGQKEGPGGGIGNTDAVIHWSDNIAADDRDRLRFVFTSSYDGTASSGAGSLEGLEGMRMMVPDSHQVFVGVGDFYAGADEPSERLDVRSRTIRIRDLVPNYYDPTLTKVVVADDDGRLHWSDAAIGDCDWQMQSTNDVSTAYAGNTCPPTEVNNVGIGLQDPFAKLDVYKDVSEGGGMDIGVRSVIRINEGVKHALSGTSASPGAENVGLIVNADNAGKNWGVVSYTGSGGTGTGVVSGFFQADREGHAGDAIAVWGRVTNMSAVGVDWAGFFEGQGYLSNGPWVLSDQELKTLLSG